MMRSVASLAVAALLVPASIAAQQSAPPRDVLRRPAPTGTSAIEGIVRLDSDRPTGLRRVRVTASSAELPGGRTAITRDDGSYRIEGLPAGRYTVRAAKPGYVTMAYGAKRWNGSGRSIEIGTAQTATRIDVRLPRGAVIGGVVLDPEGQPVIGATVVALAWRFMTGPGERQLTASGPTATTDDRGEYRIFGLPAGEYIIGVAAHGPAAASENLQVIPESEMRQALVEVRPVQVMRSRPGIAPPPPRLPPPPDATRAAVRYAAVYFPGTTDAGSAVLVAVRAAEERLGTDIVVDYVPTARVSGFVSFPDLPGADVSVILSPSERAFAREGLRATRASPPSGSFSFDGVAPGRYSVVARAATSMPALARTDITVSGDDLSGVALMPLPRVTIAGRVIFDGEAPPPSHLSALRIRALATQLIGAAAPIPLPPVQLDEEGRFVVSVVPGPYHLATALPGSRGPLGPWFLASAVMNGREILDAPLDFQQSADDLLITFRDRATEVSGRVVGSDGKATADGYVVVFSANRSFWFSNSRRVVAVKARNDGTFAIRNLPPGDYFAVAADLETGEWGDVVTLERLAREADRLTVADGEKKRVDLKVSSRF